MVYGVMCIILCLVAVFCKCLKKYKDTTFLVIAGIVLFLVSALRAPSVGGDLRRYISIFTRIGRVPFKDIIKIRGIYGDIDKEIGFNYFCKMINYISSDYGLFILTTSFIIIGGVIWIIYKFSDNYYLSLLIYILFGRFAASLNVLRSCMAITFCGIALYFLINKKEIQFFIFVILATLFHKTALSFLLMYPISKIRIRYSYIIFVVILDIILFIFGDKIIVFLAKSFNYEEYLMNLGQGTGDGLLFLILATLISTSLFLKSYMENDKNASIWIYMMLIASIFVVLSMHLVVIIRIADLFTFYLCILIPNVIRSLKKENRIWGYIVVITGMIFYGYYYVYRLDDVGSNIYPYVFREF